MEPEPQFAPKDLIAPEVCFDVLTSTTLNHVAGITRDDPRLVMQDPAAAEEVMHARRNAGLYLSLDDFGAGYSSRACLKRSPFSSVKIYRAFVTDITTNTGDAAITKPIIQMGHSLQLNVIAEGVEDAEQLQLLRGSGCEQIQDFYFSRPVPADEFGGMLRARTSPEKSSSP